MWWGEGREKGRRKMMVFLQSKESRGESTEHIPLSCSARLLL